MLRLFFYGGIWDHGLCLCLLCVFWREQDYTIIEGELCASVCFILFLLPHSCDIPGFVIYLLENYDTISEPLETEFFKYNLSTGRSKAFLNTREVTKRFNLPPGTYVIIPSTFEPGRQGSFLLRTFTEKQNKKQTSSESWCDKSYASYIMRFSALVQGGGH